MKIQELRIGNLIEFNGNANPIVQICEDNFTVADIHQSKASSNYYVCDPNEDNYEDFKPIPLTETWLVIFGFEDKGDEHESKWIHKDEDLFEMYDNSLAGKFEHVWDCAFTDAPCDYVHQLQNLYFALCGKELKINTKK